MPSWAGQLLRGGLVGSEILLTVSLALQYSGILISEGKCNRPHPCYTSPDYVEKRALGALMSSRAVSKASVLLRVSRENAFMHTAFSDRQGCPACFCPPLPYKSFVFLKKSRIVPASLGTPVNTRGSFLRGPCVFCSSSVVPAGVRGHISQGVRQNVQGQGARESKSLLPWH